MSKPWCLEKQWNRTAFQVHHLIEQPGGGSWGAASRVTSTELAGQACWPGLLAAFDLETSETREVLLNSRAACQRGLFQPLEAGYLFGSLSCRRSALCFVLTRQ
ncbi:unnamed protein product [Boreogadus saida]